MSLSEQVSSLNSTGICYLSPVELGRLIQQRELSPVTVVQAYFAHIKERNPTINAYVILLEEQALQQQSRLSMT